MNTYDQITRHFNTKEFKCRGKDCCGHSAPINPELLKRLEQVRLFFGMPLKITSGFRCQVHNKSIGSMSTSQHTKGLAADFLVPKCFTSDHMAVYCKRYFNGIGIYNTFIHVDMRERKATWRGNG